MNVLNRIKLKISRGEFAFSDHSIYDKLEVYNFSTDDILSAVRTCEKVIKQTNDIRGTRYVISVSQPTERRFDVICRFRSDGYLIFITIYDYE